MKEISNFIVFDGSHGSGKTTQAQLLNRFLTNDGIESLYTKEPYLKCTKFIIGAFGHINNIYIALIFLIIHSFDRFIHFNIIRKKAKNRTIMISDRFLFSSLVYQRIQCIPQKLIKLTNFFCSPPQITIILNIPLNERRKRLKISQRYRDSIFFTNNNLILENNFYNEIYNEYKNKWNNVYFIDSVENQLKIFDKIKKIVLLNLI